jgi:hypothetical protein
MYFHYRWRKVGWGRDGKRALHLLVVVAVVPRERGAGGEKRGEGALCPGGTITHTNVPAYTTTKKRVM